MLVMLILWVEFIVAVVMIGRGRHLDHRARCLTEYELRLDERSRLLGVAERVDDNVLCDGALDPLIRDMYPMPRIARDAS